MLLALACMMLVVPLPALSAPLEPMNFAGSVEALRAAWAPDGGSVAVVAVAGGSRSVFVCSSEGEVLARIPTDGPACAPAWSPDGTRLAVQVLDGECWTVWVTGPLGDSPVEVSGPPSSALLPQWTRQGELVYLREDGGAPYASPTAWLWSWDPADASNRPLTAPYEGGPAGPQFGYWYWWEHPHDARIAVTGATPDRTILVVSAAPRTTYAARTAVGPCACVAQWSSSGAYLCVQDLEPHTGANETGGAPTDSVSIVEDGGSLVVGSAQLGLPARLPCWLGREDRLGYVLSGHELWTYDVSSGIRRQVGALEADVADLVPAPGGDRVLAVHSVRDGAADRLSAIDLGTGNTRRLLDIEGGIRYVEWSPREDLAAAVVHPLGEGPQTLLVDTQSGATTNLTRAVAAYARLR